MKLNYYYGYLWGVLASLVMFLAVMLRYGVFRMRRRALWLTLGVLMLYSLMSWVAIALMIYNYTDSRNKK